MTGQHPQGERTNSLGKLLAFKVGQATACPPPFPTKEANQMKFVDVICAFENLNGNTEYEVLTYKCSETEAAQRAKVEMERRTDDLFICNGRVIATAKAGEADDVIAMLLVGEYR